MQLTRAITAVTLLAFTAACRESATEPQTPADALTRDVAVVSGDAAYEDVGVIYAQIGTFGVPMGDVGRVTGWTGPCPYDATTERFTCPVQTREGRTFSRSYAFRDATGNAQRAYDGATTASANFQSSMAGSVERDGWSATMSHERDMTASGLVGTETSHTINGTGSSTESRSRHTDGGLRTYRMSSVATFTNVVVPVPRARGAWPVSGTITRTVTAVREGVVGSVSHERMSTTTFNGTRFASMTVGDRTFTLDLATGRAVRKP